MGSAFRKRNFALQVEYKGTGVAKAQTTREIVAEACKRKTTLVGLILGNALASHVLRKWRFAYGELLREKSAIAAVESRRELAYTTTAFTIWRRRYRANRERHRIDVLRCNELRKLRKKHLFHLWRKHRFLYAALKHVRRKIQTQAIAAGFSIWKFRCETNGLHRREIVIVQYTRIMRRLHQWTSRRTRQHRAENRGVNHWAVVAQINGIKGLVWAVRREKYLANAKENAKELANTFRQKRALAAWSALFQRRILPRVHHKLKRRQRGFKYLRDAALSRNTTAHRMRSLIKWQCVKGQLPRSTSFSESFAKAMTTERR